MIPVILSGGSGTRLWPVSRASYPKQFCEFYDRSFLRNSMDRLKSFGKPHILTVESMRNLTLKTLLDSGYDRSQAIYEPFGKNTGPAVGLLCHWMVLNGHEQEVVGVFPADHLVTREDQFQKAVSLAVECAEQGELVTLGIQPTYPATGYGYIEVTQEVFKEGAEHTAFVVQGFREKPDEALASEFVDSGHYFWNAGMFVFKVSRMVELFKEYLPDMWRRIETIKKDLSNLKHVYANLESVSLDYGLMEKLQRQICIPCEIGWSDVGSWDEISRISEDQNKMVTDSKAI
ncbi:MAG: mannose-1-phosphate guanylyltransferase, partial [Bdellovibrionales bacterium]|nr:mannose-1-phosphate guanylyltransferase [Bdellovibrionales bacterium]